MTGVLEVKELPLDSSCQNIEKEGPTGFPGAVLCNSV